MATKNGLGTLGVLNYVRSSKLPTVTPLPHSLPPDLWTSEMEEVLKTKKRAYRRYKSHNCEDSQVLFRACRSRLRWLMKQAVAEHMKTLDEDGKIELLDWQVELWGKRRKILIDRPAEEKLLREAEGWVEVEPTPQPVHEEYEAEPDSRLPAYRPSYGDPDVSRGNRRSRVEKANWVDPAEEVIYNTKRSDILDRAFGKN